MPQPGAQLDTPPLPAGVAALIQNELEPGERIVWVGQPGEWGYAGASRGVCVGTVVVPIVTAAAWPVVMRHMRGMSSESGLLFLSLVLCIMAVFAVHVLGLARQGRHTAYAITNLRVVIASAWPWGRAVSFEPATLCEPKVRAQRDGSGTILLTEYGRPPGRRALHWRQFARIANVATVAEQIAALARTATPEAVAAFAEARSRPRVKWSALPLFVLFGLSFAGRAGRPGLSSTWRGGATIAGGLLAVWFLVSFVRSVVRVCRYRARRGRPNPRPAGPA